MRRRSRPKGGSRTAPTSPFELRPIGKSKPRYRPEDRDPRLDPALLAEHAEGLILLTGCRQGQLSQLVDAGRYAEAEALLRQYVDWFGAEQCRRRAAAQPGLRRHASGSPRLVQLAEQVGVALRRHRQRPLPPSGAAPPAGCAGRHPPPHHARRLPPRAPAERAVLPPLRRRRWPRASPRYPEALATPRSDRRALRSLRPRPRSRLPLPRLPDRPPARRPTTAWRASAASELRRRYRRRTRPRRRERLDEELRVIAKHELAGFFLLYRDLLRAGARGRGRGPRRDTARAPRQSAARAGARLLGQLDRLLPDRALARRPARAQPLLRPLPQRGDALDPRHRSRFPARDPRAADRARLRASTGTTTPPSSAPSRPTSCAARCATSARRSASRWPISTRSPS